MEIEAVKISNFRSVQDTDWIEIENDITTLIGKNESGKTTILKSISEISHRDRIQSPDINDSTEPDPFTPIIRAKYKHDSARVEVIKLRGGARVLGDISDISVVTPFSNELLSDAIFYIIEERVTNINDKKVDKFKNSFNIPNSNKVNNLNKENTQELINNILHELLEPTISEETPIARRIESLLEREMKRIDDRNYPISEFIDEKLPTIVYMDSTDQLPDQIPKSELGSDSHETFNNLVKISGFDPDEIGSMDPREQVEVIDKISATIEGDLNNLWDQKSVKVNVREANSNYIPLVRDESVDGDNVSREPRIPSERSKGFQWFLSFHINASAVANESEEKLFLLDDPAVFLHPEGKKDWLDAIEDLSQNNQVIYTSHSPYLIYKDQPSRVRIVEDRSGSGTVVLDEFHDSNQASLEPLRKALGINIGSTPFATKRKILVEGPSDKYILRGAIHYLHERGEDIISRHSTSIIPTAGANKMITVARWVDSEDFSYVILLDKDGKGDNVAGRIKTEAPELDSDQVLQLELDDDGKNQHIEIEDMVPAEFYIDCVNTAYKDKIEDYTPVELREEDSQRYINSVEYNNRKIASKIEEAFEECDNGGLNKLMVAKEIESRFLSGDVEEEIFSDFKIVLGKVAGRL